MSTNPSATSDIKENSVNIIKLQKTKKTSGSNFYLVSTKCMKKSLNGAASLKILLKNKSMC
jgi:hypothetical protein